MKFNKFFKGVSRVTRTFKLEAGPFRAQGVPAVLVAVTGVLVAAALAKSASNLPETLREARALAQTMRNEPARLRP